MYLFSSHLRYGHVSSYSRTRLRSADNDRASLELLINRTGWRSKNEKQDPKAEFLCVFLSPVENVLILSPFICLRTAILFICLFSALRLFGRPKLHSFHYLFAATAADALVHLMHHSIFVIFPPKTDDTQIFDLFL